MPKWEIEFSPYLCATEHSIILKVALFVHCIWKNVRDIGIGPASISFLLFNKQVLSPYSMSGSGDTAVNKTSQVNILLPIMNEERRQALNK